VGKDEVCSNGRDRGLEVLCVWDFDLGFFTLPSVEEEEGDRNNSLWDMGAGKAVSREKLPVWMPQAIDSFVVTTMSSSAAKPPLKLLALGKLFFCPFHEAFR